MKILIIDNNIDLPAWGSRDLCRLTRLAPDVTFHVRRAPENDLPKSPVGYDRILVSGSKTSALDDSPWTQVLFEFIRRAISHQIPYLGVCYGHQALIRALGTKEHVRKAETAEFGWTQIQVLEPSTLLAGLPSEFYSFSAHFEEACALPSGMRTLASSKDCEIQACQLENLPVFGIQFHPEKTPHETEQILLERKKLGTPPVLLNPRGADLNKNPFYNPIVGESIFKNFLRN